MAALAAASLAACAGGSADPQVEKPRASKACKLLTAAEVESFFAEKASPARPDEAEGVADTCRWGDANPAVPGKILSLTLEPAGAVDEVRPEATDNVYELPSLGEDALGIQLTGGGVRVVFTVGTQRVDVGYDVVPRDSQESDAIDRLIRLAGRVFDRLGGVPVPTTSPPDGPAGG